MNIDKAIEIKENHQRLHRDEYYQWNEPQELLEADNLSIEALKREKRNRDDPDLVLVGLLPGETEK